jgi:undecaprenyl-diphosphatase
MDIANAFAAAVIGVIEGLTEFLPVSSTGHIMVAQRMLRFADPGEVFGVVIQLGAILAVCVYFHARIRHLVTRAASDAAARRFILNVVVASVPAAVVGMLLNHWLEEHVFTATAGPWIIANTFALGGLAILAIERRPVLRPDPAATTKRLPHVTDSDDIPVGTAIAIGCCQMLAMIPGVSRSGATILGGMLLGVERRAATEFSFFLAIPVMFGASALKLKKHWHELDGRGGAIAIGFVVSFAVALATVHWLLRFVAHRNFRPFGWYRIGAGLVLAILLAAHLLPPPLDPPSTAPAPSPFVRGR